MANYNRIMLIGNLTRDPQLSYLPSQTAVVEFGLAVNRKWTGKDGEKKEDTCFVDCQAFAGRAETINKYLSKGSPVFVEGRLKFDSWTAQDGSKKSKLRVVVDNFQFLGGPKPNNAQGRQSSGQETSGPAEPSSDDIPF